MSKKKKKYISKNNQELETNLPAPIISPEKNIGRPSDYEKKVLPYLDKISYWVLLGYTNLDIANKLGIDESTFYDYKKQFPEFSKTVEKNKPLANEQVVRSGFKRACGFEYTETTEELEFKRDKDGRIIYDEYDNPLKEMVVTKAVRKFVPPDTNAFKFWIVNRDPDNWKLKEASTEVNIDNSKNENTQNNIQNNNTFNYMTTEQRQKALTHYKELFLANNKQYENLE